jgi:uncharacterized membrane protein (DUF373 family)
MMTSNWNTLRGDWALMSLYQRFEALVALVVTAAVSTVILVALYRLIVDVIYTLALSSLNPLEHAVFQHVFGQIMTLLIALEFNHTLRYVVAGERSLVQTRVVLLIALLALARKIIVMDLAAVTPSVMAGIAGLVLSLGVTYWLMRARDERLASTAADEIA